MSRKTKIWLIVAASLIFIGLIIFGGTMTVMGWDFTKLSTCKFETNNHEITESYKSISIVTNTADMIFMPSDNSSTSVICFEEEKVKHLVTVENDTLTVKVCNTKKWYEHIGIMFGTPKITIYLPEGEYGALMINESTGAVEIPNNFKFESIDISTSTGAVRSCASAKGDIKIKTSTGAIYVDGISAASVELCVSTGKVTASDITCEGDVSVKVSTGKAELDNIKCKNLISTGNTGSVSLKNVIASEKFSIKRSTGNIKLDGFDAAEILIETDTGDVTGTLFSSKVFVLKTDTGKIDAPKSTNGGICEIKTDTGDIKISIGQ